MERFEHNGVPGQETLARVPVVHNDESEGKGDTDEESDYWGNINDGYDCVGESDGGNDDENEGYDPRSVNSYQRTT